MRHSEVSGFTLIELLLAISLTAVVGAMSYAGFDAVTSADRRLQTQADRIREINLAMTILARDLRQIQPRPIRDEYGAPITAFWGNGNGENIMAFTRAGWSNPTGRNQSKLQRVRYHHRDGQLVRESWNVLDRVSDSKSYSTPILSRLEDVQVRFLAPIPNDDVIERSEWRTQWVPTDLPEYDNAFSPMAIEINLGLEDWGSVQRLYITSFHWPDTLEFKRLGLEQLSKGRTQQSSVRTQRGSGRTQRGSGRTQRATQNTSRDN